MPVMPCCCGCPTCPDDLPTSYSVNLSSAFTPCVDDGSLACSPSVTNYAIKAISDESCVYGIDLDSACVDGKLANHILLSFSTAPGLTGCDRWVFEIRFTNQFNEVAGTIGYYVQTTPDVSYPTGEYTLLTVFCGDATPGGTFPATVTIT